MTTTDKFFEQVVKAARSAAVTEGGFAVDRHALMCYGMTAEQASAFIQKLRPAANTDEFRILLEHTILQAYKHLFTVMDDIVSGYGDQVAVICNTQGTPLSEELHALFEEYLQTHGHTKVVDPY